MTKRSTNSVEFYYMASAVRFFIKLSARFLGYGGSPWSLRGGLLGKSQVARGPKGFSGGRKFFGRCQGSFLFWHIPVFREKRRTVYRIRDEMFRPSVLFFVRQRPNVSWKLHADRRYETQS